MGIEKYAVWMGDMLKVFFDVVKTKKKERERICRIVIISVCLVSHIHTYLHYARSTMCIPEEYYLLYCFILSYFIVLCFSDGIIGKWQHQWNVIANNGKHQCVIWWVVNSWYYAIHLFTHFILSSLFKNGMHTYVHRYMHVVSINHWT